MKEQDAVDLNAVTGNLQKCFGNNPKLKISLCNSKQYITLFYKHLLIRLLEILNYKVIL